MTLDGKIAVITGASRGLGKCLAEVLTQRGAKVVVSARSGAELEQVAEATGAMAIPCDVTHEDEVNTLVRETVTRFGRLDIFVNNAGVWTPRRMVEETPIAEIRRMFEVNVFGLIFGSRAAYQQMMKQGTGTIVNIISTSALVARPGSSGYSASKHAAAGFTKALTAEAAEKGVQVFAIYPGGIKTHLFDAEKPADYDDYMDPSDIAEKIVTHLERNEHEPELILRRN